MDETAFQMSLLEIGATSLLTDEGEMEQPNEAIAAKRGMVERELPKIEVKWVRNLLATSPSDLVRVPSSLTRAGIKVVSSVFCNNRMEECSASVSFKQKSALSFLGQLRVLHSTKVDGCIAEGC